MIDSQTKSKYIIIFTVFVDILGLGIVIPVLPFYLKSFGASDFIIISLFSVFSLFAFISSPFLGSLSDRIGRRPVLIASIASTALGWIIFASAKTLPFLFLGRIIDGLAAGNISTAQSYLIDISKDQKERSANLGLIGAMFGIGLTVGPLIGGLLGSIAHTLPFWIAGGLALINTVLAFFQLPETHHQREGYEKISPNPLKPIINALQNKLLLPSFISWFLFGTAVACQQAVFSLHLNRVFGFKEFVAGLFLTGIGITLSINQAFFLRKFWIKKFKEPDLEFYMMIALAVGFLLMDVPHLEFFILGVVCFTISHSVLRVVMTSQISGASGNKQGEVMGIMNSIMSLSAIIGPIAAGWMFAKHITWPYIASAVIILFALMLIVINKKRLANQPMDAETPASFSV